MNQPTREEFDQLVERVTRIEQRTEEIKAVRVEVASEDVINRLKALEQGQQELKEDTVVIKDDVGVLKIEMQGARADILQIRESQADLRDRLIEHGSHLKAIGEKQDAHTELLEQFINVGESHTKRFDQVDTSIAELKSAQAEQGGLLKLILAELRKSGGE